MTNLEENIWDKAEILNSEYLEYGYIYGLFEDDNLVYIGQTIDIYNRMSGHKHLKSNPHLICKFFKVKKENLNKIESELILKNLPILNKTIPDSEYLTLDQCNKIHTIAYTNRVGFLRELKNVGANCINGHYHINHVNLAIKNLLGGE